MAIKTKRVDTKHVIVVEADDENRSGFVNPDAYLAKRLANGGLERIPDEEPVIAFRGRDHLSLPLLREYRKMCVDDNCNAHQLESLDTMIQAFEEFSAAYPERMKQPGVTRGR